MVCLAMVSNAEKVRQILFASNLFYTPKLEAREPIIFLNLFNLVGFKCFVVYSCGTSMTEEPRVFVFPCTIRCVYKLILSRLYYQAGTAALLSNYFYFYFFYEADYFFCTLFIIRWQPNPITESFIRRRHT